MADKEAAAPSRVETGVSQTTSMVVDAGSKEVQHHKGGLSAEFDRDDVKVRAENEDAPEPEAEGEENTEEVGEEQEASEGDDAEAPEDLGEWNPEDPEVKAKYDERYFGEDGKLNRGVLADEFFRNYSKAENKADAGLNESTYAYLNDTLGLSKETVKEIERGQLALAQQNDTAFFERVGGKDRYEAALKWGRDGGYTKEQQERFNALRKKGGPDFDDAVDALMQRYFRANRGKRQEQREAAEQPARRGPPKPRRASTPQRSAADRAGAGGEGAAGDIYKNYHDYEVDFQKAYKSGNKAEQAKVHEKLKRSRHVWRGSK